MSDTCRMHQFLVHEIVKDVFKIGRKVKNQEQLLIFPYWVAHTGSKILTTQFSKQLSELNKEFADEEVIKSEVCLTCYNYDCPH